MVPLTMKAAMMQGNNEITIEELPVPQPAGDEALIQIKAVGVCGSDVHLFAHGGIGSCIVRPPYILGHEAAGQVVAVGDEVTGLKPGDRITMEPGIPCGQCEHCKSGQYNLCRSVIFWAAPPVPGVLAEYVTHKAGYCYKVADHVPFDVASLAEPLAVGIYAAKRGKAAPGKSVAILGMGPIGQTVLQSVLAYGASNILVSDLVESRLQVARRMGARVTVNTTREDIKEVVAKLTDGNGVDLVIESAGAARAAVDAVHIAKSGGTIVMVGNPPDTDVAYPLLDLVSRELTLLGSFRYANIYPIAIDVLATHTANFKELISHHYPLNRSQEAFEMVRDHKNECMKVVINVDEV